MSDGSMRSVQEYAGGGKVGYARIGVDPIGVDPIPEPEYRGQTFDRTAQEWKDGGDVEEEKEEKKEKKTLKEKIQSVRDKLKSKKSSKKPKKKMKIWKDGKVVTESKSKKKEDKNIKKNTKKINKLGPNKLIIPKNVDVTKSKPTGKLKKGMQSVTITEGGAYPTYKKKSKPAKSFRKAFSEARDAFLKGEGKKTFMWDGRKYTTEVKK